MLAAGLQPGEDQARRYLPRLRISAVIARLVLVFLLVFSAGAALAQQPQTIDSIRVIGNRRIPKETILARLFTHPGDTYDPISIERDFNSLWNTGYFENVRIEREDTEKGIILNIFVRRSPPSARSTTRASTRSRLPTFSTASRRRRSVSRSKASTIRTKIERADTVLKDMLAEHGHQFATIKTEVKTIPPASVQVNFNIKEGPTVKVGKIKFTGNQHLSCRYLRRSMKNLKPIGIPYSIIFEDLFAQTFDASKLEEDTERVRQAYRDKGYYNAAVEEPRNADSRRGRADWFTFRPNKGKRIDILHAHRRGRALPARHHHLHRQQGRSTTSRRCAPPSRSRTATGSTPP